jgi:hypothetical protein
MHTRRWLASVIVALGVVVSNPVSASADGGGAYIDLGHKTHYLPGETAHAKTTVSIPAGKQGVLERGPFHLYVTPYRKPITDGEPLPDGAVRVATFTIRPGRGSAFTLTASFTVPDLPGDYYSLGVCNDPCTVAGFREPIWGQISIVQTTREAELLNEEQHLMGRIYGLRRQIRKGRRAEADLESQLSSAGMQQIELRGTIGELRTKLANARAEADRTSFSWLSILLAILALALVGTVATISSRRRRMRVRDVPAMVAAPKTFERRREGSFR